MRRMRQVILVQYESVEISFDTTAESEVWLFHL